MVCSFPKSASVAPIVRVLIVEDFAEWRRELRGLVEGAPSLRVVGEAEDGVEGVRRAADLAPEIVLLDLNLPVLNGIEVAKTILGSGKHPKIIFVTENRSLEIAQQAFNIGALAYVVKSEVRRELLAAVHAVLEGKRFVSKALYTDSSQVHPSDRQPLDQQEGALALSHGIGFRHEVAFYENDSNLEAGFSEYAKAAMHAQKAVLLVATETHRTNIYRRLRQDGIDLKVLMATGTYNQMEATTALSRIMVNNSPDPLRFREILEDVVRNIPTLGGASNRKLAICAECAPTLLMQGEVEAAMELEQHWGALSLCTRSTPYVDTFGTRSQTETLLRCFSKSALSTLPFNRSREETLRAGFCQQISLSKPEHWPADDFTL